MPSPWRNKKDDVNGVANRKILLLSLSRSVSAYYNGLFFFHYCCCCCCCCGGGLIFCICLFAFDRQRQIRFRRHSRLRGCPRSPVRLPQGLIRPVGHWNPRLFILWNARLSTTRVIIIIIIRSALFLLISRLFILTE